MSGKIINKFKKGTIIVLSALLIISIIFIAWAQKVYEPTEEAIEVFKNQESIEIIQDEFIIFKPKNDTVKKGFIFYPGGKVNPESYSVLAEGIAEKGYLVVIVPMPLDLAVLSPNKAEEVINMYSDIETWAIGGHSLGGVIASRFASENDNVKGLALYASYPSGDELVDKTLEVISIYGSEDGVADLEKIKNANLSKNSELFEIKGGNHSQFGNYGHQEGDNNATISSNDQITETINITVRMLEELK
ncbi:alpha/beta family hydrolase [Clostridium sp. AL.422]|uniref:alpha/beta family hydrolase n=1 Tax=Clostridium TaxID=1485 RepID=UPI00293DD0DF|nr:MULTISPECIES: alpha/beta family hydrolase [unclassified Clostridium]MDV4150475.1 alpha/beta family hydrolase [Clostridium sp. AL.422]